MLSPLVSILARGALLFGLTTLEVASPARAELVFMIDQRYGSIEFSVQHLGLFSSEGKFDRFNGVLNIDPAHPEHASFRITIDATSLDMSWNEAIAMLRAPDFFDVTSHPVITYVSHGVAPQGDRHYAIAGELQIRGVARPQPLDALLLRRQVDPVRHVETADFAVTGKLKRSDFGMVANQTFISDAVTLTIHVRVELPHSPEG
jgi:polyisoprenoid-binding protein YceI